MNTVILIGRLGADPEAGKSEKAPATFSLAVDRRSDDAPDWFDVAAFGALGEAVLKSCKKGRQVAVRGRLVQDRWETTSGEKRSRVKVIASEVQFLAKPGTSSAESDSVEAPDEEEPF